MWAEEEKEGGGERRDSLGPVDAALPPPHPPSIATSPFVFLLLFVNFLPYMPPSSAFRELIGFSKKSFKGLERESERDGGRYRTRDQSSSLTDRPRALDDDGVLRDLWHFNMDGW